MDEFQDALAALFALTLLHAETDAVRAVLDDGDLEDEKDGQRFGVRLANRGAVSAENGALVDNLAQELIRYCYHDLATAFELFGGIEKAEALLGREVNLAKAAELATRPLELGAPSTPASWHITLEELPGRYTHVSEHAKGGMGRVLIVSDTNMGRDVALKELLPPSETATTEGESPARTVAAIAARFLQEARVTAALEHPAIVPVYELGRRRNGTLYYTMKLVRGQTLAKRLAASKTLVERLELLQHLVDLCQAIAYAHSRGVIHRDLKPSNIMVGEFGETVALDWGIARVRNEPDPIADDIRETTALVWQGLDTPPRTAYGSAIGTPHYMSPEQAQGKLDEIDERSDVYALGVILYEILTGQVPHQGETMSEVIRRVSEDPPADPLSIAKDAPPELASICRKAMSRKRGQRYHSAQEMAADIRRFQSGLLVKAYAYKPWETLKILYKRYRTPVNAAAIATAAILLTFTVAFVQIWRANESERAQRLIAEQAEQEAVEARDIAEREAYAANIQLASLQAEGKRFRDAANVLLSTSEDMRGWEWGYLYGDANRHVIELSPHGGFVFRTVFLPNPDRVMTLSSDMRLHVWNWRTETELYSFSTEPEWLRDAQPSLDGDTLAVATGGGRIIVLDAGTGDIRFERQAHQGFANSLDFNRDGTLLFSGGSDGLAKLWQWPSLELVAEFTAPSPTVVHVELSADGAIGVARTHEGRVRAWQLDTGQTLLDTPGTMMAMHPSEPWLAVTAETASMYDLAEGVNLWRAPADLRNPSRVRFSQGGAWAIMGYDDGTVRLVSSSSGSQITAYSLGEPVHDFGTNADDTMLAANSGRGLVRVWEVATGRLRNTFTGHRGGIVRAVPHPEESLILTASSDGSARIWLADDERIVYASTDDIPNLFDMSHDAAGARVAVSGVGPGMVVIDIEQRKPIMRMGSLGASFRRAMALAPGGDRALFSADGHTPFIVSVPEGEVIAQLPNHAGGVQGAAYSPDGAIIATAGWGDPVRLWDAETGALRQTFDIDAGAALEIAFFPQGGRLATGSRKGIIEIWNLGTLQIERTLEHHGGIRALAISHDERLLAAGTDLGDALLWRLDRDEPPLMLYEQAAGLPQPAGHRPGVTGAAFVEGEDRLLTVGTDSVLNIWDTTTGRAVLSTPFIDTVARGVALLPDTGHAFLAGSDGRARLIAAPPHQVAALGADPGVPYAEAFARYRRGLRDTLLERAGPAPNPERIAWIAAEDKLAQAAQALQARMGNGPVTIRRAELDEGAAHLGLRQGDRVQAARLPDTITLQRGGRVLLITLRPAPVERRTEEIRLDAERAQESFRGVRDFWISGLEAVQTVNFDIARMLGMRQPTIEAIEGFWLIPGIDERVRAHYLPFGLAPADRITHIDGEEITNRAQIFEWLDRAVAEADQPTGEPMHLRVERGQYAVIELSIAVEP